MKRCFVGTWISPGMVLTPAGLELSLGGERGNGGSRCVAMAMQGAAAISTGLLSFRFSARTESPRQGLAVLGAPKAHGHPRPPTATHGLVAPLTPSEAVGQGDCSSHSQTAAQGSCCHPPAPGLPLGHLGLSLKKKTNLCLLKLRFFSKLHSSDFR